MEEGDRCYVIIESNESYRDSKRIAIYRTREEAEAAKPENGTFGWETFSYHIATDHISKLSKYDRKNLLKKK